MTSDAAPLPRPGSSPDTVPAAEPGLHRLDAHMRSLSGLAASIRSGSAYPEDRSFGKGGPADAVNQASACLNPEWDGGSNELRAVLLADQACTMLDSRAAASGTERDQAHAARARSIRDALWREYQPRDLTGTLITAGDEVEVTGPDGTVRPLASMDEARTLPPGAMRITSRPEPRAHPADLYPNLIRREGTEAHRRKAAAALAGLAIRHARYLPHGKTVRTARPWEAEAAAENAKRHAAAEAARQAADRDAAAVLQAAAARQYDHESGGTPDPHVPPVLRRTGHPAGNGLIRVIDHKGRVFQTRLDDGTVTVAFGRQQASAPAGTSPTRTARELAGRLTGEYTPAEGPYAALAAKARELADRIISCDPGPVRTDHSQTVPLLLDAARHLDNSLSREGTASLDRAAGKLDEYAADDFKTSIGLVYHLSDNQARDCAAAVRSLRRDTAAASRSLAPVPEGPSPVPRETPPGHRRPAARAARPVPGPGQNQKR